MNLLLRPAGLTSERDVMRSNTHRASPRLGARDLLAPRWRWFLVGAASLLILASCRADKGGSGPPTDLTDATQSEVLEDTVVADVLDVDDVTEPDTAPDVLPDVLPDVVTPVAVPPGFGVTSGGGAVRSNRFKMQVAIGGPSPVSDVSGTRFKARVGVAIPQLP